ncbi:MAG: hypothetical protein VR64_16205 [Desulfatitalea sp. BRH_c12]|nr:MAG: hypothetical protein VR64_16205 [Desulfatitalea sp. BRH_c12]
MTERAKQIEQLATLLVIAVLVVGSVVIVFPFMRAILWAVVFAVAMWPFFLKVERALGGRTRLAAMVPTLLLALIFFLPLFYAGSRIVAKTSITLDYAQGLLEKKFGPPPIWFESLPLVGDRLEEIWWEIGRNSPKLIEMIKPHAKNLLGSIVSAGTGMARFGLTALLSLVLLFFILRDGRPIRISIERMALQLGGEKGLRLLFVAASTMRSVVYGILFSAVVQGILSFFGLWISGVPNPVLIGTAAGLFALVPVGLIHLILLPAAGWLIFQGHMGWGIFLFIWAIALVGNIDNVIRPMLISRGAKVPFLVILLGVLGGLTFGGIIGLFVGATLLAVFYTMLKEWVVATDEESNAVPLVTDRIAEMEGPHPLNL